MKYDVEKIFNIEVIEDAKINVIKLYKMNLYLDEFISKEENYTQKLYSFIKIITEKIKFQRD
jgi:hypothetical protein